MQSELTSLQSSVPGVLGSMAVDAHGRILASAFPSSFEPARLQAAATLVADRTAALDGALGAVGTVDLRFASSRLVVRAAGAARLVVLCAPTVSLPLLSMALGGVVRRLGHEPGRASGAAAADAPVAGAAPSPGSGELWRTVQRIDELLAGHGGNRFKLRGLIAMKAGFALDLVEPDSPDDPERLQRLRAAAAAVLGHI
ncbi:MAG TPA: roadblock/LC7 domain-containing protein [Anaeromyxobacteraceae bacterium]|nr:roadblock/LC7 domain-containing protein [Anaeromyxobacteraceae bacterium]